MPKDILDYEKVYLLETCGLSNIKSCVLVDCINIDMDLKDAYVFHAKFVGNGCDEDQKQFYEQLSIVSATNEIELEPGVALEYIKRPFADDGFSAGSKTLQFFSNFANRGVILTGGDFPDNKSPLVVLGAVNEEYVKDDSYRPFQYGFIRRDSYNPKTSELMFCGKTILLCRQKNKTGSRVKESHSARIMRLLLSTESSFTEGIHIRKVHEIRNNQVDKDYRKKVKNTVDYLNRIIANETGVKDLVILKDDKLFINKKHRSEF